MSVKVSQEYTSDFDLYTHVPVIHVSFPRVYANVFVPLESVITLTVQSTLYVIPFVNSSPPHHAGPGGHGGHITHTAETHEKPLSPCFQSFQSFQSIQSRQSFPFFQLIQSFPLFHVTQFFQSLPFTPSFQSLRLNPFRLVNLHHLFKFNHLKAPRFSFRRTQKILVFLF
mgnify:CR=1 FL=1